MNELNYGIFTGIVIRKDKNASNQDIQRPVVDVEIMCVNKDGDMLFKEVPMLFSGSVLSKTVTGLNIGDIVTVMGEIRSDNVGIYIDVESFSRHTKNERGANLTRAKSELLQLPQRFNIANIIGIVKNSKEFAIVRKNFSRGDLKKEDNIPIYIKEPIADGYAICYGELGVGEDGDICLFANNMLEIKSEE